MATFVIKFVTENFTKSPNLVTLIAKRRQRNQSYKENISVNVHYTDFKHSAWLKILNRLIMSVALNYNEKLFTASVPGLQFKTFVESEPFQRGDQLKVYIVINHPFKVKVRFKHLIN